ncbi:MAG: T9SS type A sorting domain-containing protein [Ferruginibacter sp.]
MKKLSTLLLLAMVIISLPAFSIPKLNSYPSSPATIYLDFDGHTVNGTLWNAMNNYNTIYAAASGLNDVQITEIFNRVSEDYRPFAVNITTDSTVFLNAPVNQRLRMIVTPTSAWCPGVGGACFIGSFTSGDDSPGFVFCDRLGPNSPKMVAECCSHESGHGVGLDHQSKYDASNCDVPLQEYNPGVGSGETGWAPIMGNSYYKNMSNWNNGATPWGCTVMQDNLSTIVTQNGFGYRPDDFNENLDNSAYALPASSFNISGIITTDADRDAFRLVLTNNANIHITAIPYSVGANSSGANLDIKVDMFNAAGTLIRSYDPQATMSVTIDTMLTTGTYYLRLDGTGNTNISEYGSLGSYTLSGFSGPLPIHEVSLTGTADKGRHNLSWKIIADEPVKNLVIESSADGIHFNSLASVDPSAVQFSYASYQNSVLYYRLKVTSVINQTAFSNVIALNGVSSTDKAFYVSTLVQNEITINAPNAYKFLLSDINGRSLSQGAGLKGVNKLNVNDLPSGMYIIQLFNDDQRQTERIIKQ